MKIRFILSDLDGVVRIFPPEHVRCIETRYGIPVGTIFNIAFDKELLLQAVCGAISDEAWRTEIARALAKVLSCEQSAAEAIREWASFSGHVDDRYLRFLGERFPGIPLILLSNGTSRLNEDLIKLGIHGRFSRIFNSAEIGVCKPDVKIFQHVLKQLRCEPSEILFVDDSLSHVQAASALGMVTHHYKALETFSDAFPEI